MLVWFPRVNGGPQLFYFQADNIDPTNADPYRHKKGLPSTGGGIPIVGATSYWDTGLFDGTNRTRYKYWKLGLA